MSEAALPQLSILMPVYNEIRTLPTILAEIEDAALPLPYELIIVDDASTDGSRAYLEAYCRGRENVHLLLQPRNVGKGAALRRAIETASGRWAVLQDADLEYVPSEINRLLTPALSGFADAVFGSRFMPGPYRRALFYRHALANRFLTFLTSLATDLLLTDIETCYKLIKLPLLKALDLRSNGFDIEPELVIKLARCRARIYEAPISYRGRTYEEGKKIGVRDALAAIVGIVRHRVSPHLVHDPNFSSVLVHDRAARNSAWTLRQLESCIGEEVLEVGANIGSYTRMLLERRRLVCMEKEPLYAEILDGAFGHLSNIHVAQGDAQDPAMWEEVRDGGLFDTVVCVNVLEHLDDDAGVLAQFERSLRPGGCAALVVPQNPSLAGSIDVGVSHRRRYTAAELRAKLERAGFEAITLREFNKPAGLAWWLSCRLQRKDRLDPWGAKLFDMALPLLHLLEYIPLLPASSLVCTARKGGPG